MGKHDNLSDGEIFEDVYDFDVKDAKAIQSASTLRFVDVLRLARSLTYSYGTRNNKSSTSVDSYYSISTNAADHQARHSELIRQFRREWKDCDIKRKDFWMEMYLPARDSTLKTALQALQGPSYASFGLPGDSNRKRKAEERSFRRAQRVDKQKEQEAKEEAVMEAAKEQTAKKEPGIKEEEVDEQMPEKGDTKRRRVVGLHKRLKKAFFDELSHLDCVMYEARVNEYRCSGSLLQVFDATKMQEELDQNSDTTQGYLTSSQAADLLGFKMIPLDALKKLPDAPFVILDNNKTPPVYNFPKCVSRKGESYTHLLLQLGKQTTLPAEPIKEDASGAPKLVGCVKNAHTAMALQESEPSTGVDHKTVDFHPMQHHLSHTRKFGTIINYALYRTQPESFWAHFKMSEALRADYPGVGVATTHDPGFFFRQSYTYSQDIPFHTDSQQPAEGWAPLTMMGDCQTGTLALPRLGVKFSFLPGALVFIRGKFVEYGTTDWAGDGTRICVTRLNHVAEWEAAKVDPSLET